MKKLRAGRLKSRNACYHSVQNLVFSSLLSKNIKIKIYTAVIFPVLACVCECVAWSLALRLFKNTVLRKTTKWGTSWSVLLTKYYSGDQIKKNEMDRECSMYGGEVRCIQDFGGETWENEPLGRLRCRWKDNIKMDLQEVGWGGMD
jgi:hypothetical protein